MVSNDIVAQLAVKVVNVKYWIYMLDVLQNWPLEERKHGLLH